jgi:hypothetical protein
MIGGDLSVPLALSIFLVRGKDGKTKMPKPVRKVLERWLRGSKRKRR